MYDKKYPRCWKINIPSHKQDGYSNAKGAGSVTNPNTVNVQCPKMYVCILSGGG